MLAMPPKLVEAAPGDGYEVRLRFADGLAADVDLSYLLEYGGIFEPLGDPGYFRRLKIDEGGNTIAWPNEADIAPATLYDHAQRADYDGRAASARA